MCVTCESERAFFRWLTQGVVTDPANVTERQE
jgi:hypothetical protein